MPEISLGVLLFIPYRHLEQQIIQTVLEAGFDMTLAQARLAQRIDDNGSRLTTLAESAQVTKQTAQFLVDQLERGGYIRRVADPTDARAKLVRFTARGREVIEVATDRQRQIEAQWRDHLGAEDYDALVAALTRLREITDPYA